jgi:hypothetical protein
MLFANHTRACAAVSSPNIDNTFECLMSASPSDLLVGTKAGLAIEPWPFRAVLDRPEGIMSDLPARRLSHGAGGRVPFIAGTVLDEGPFVSYGVDEQYAHTKAQGRSFFRGALGLKILPPG